MLILLILIETDVSQQCLRTHSVYENLTPRVSCQVGFHRAQMGTKNGPSSQGCL